MAIFYGIAATPAFRNHFFPWSLRMSAEASGAILKALGEQISIQQAAVASPRCTLEIKRGCDAIEPSAIFAAAVLAFPAALRRKLVPILLGTAALALLNLARIISLYYTSVFWPSAFSTLHVDVWQPLFILAVALMWIAWAWRASAAAAARPQSRH
jgi:exosortase/archaeosortase family protein